MITSKNVQLLKVYYSSAAPFELVSIIMFTQCHPGRRLSLVGINTFPTGHGPRCDSWLWHFSEISKSVNVCRLTVNVCWAMLLSIRALWVIGCFWANGRVWLKTCVRSESPCKASGFVGKITFPTSWSKIFNSLFVQHSFQLYESLKANKSRLFDQYSRSRTILVPGI